MSETTGAGTPAPEPLQISAGGLTVAMAPCGFRDLIEIPEMLRAIGTMPSDDEDAVRNAMIAFADRLDSYALGDPKPSRIPPVLIADFVGRWIAGVRDAAVPPDEDGGLPSQPASPPAAKSTRSPSK